MLKEIDSSFSFLVSQGKHFSGLPIYGNSSHALMSYSSWNYFFFYSEFGALQTLTFCQSHIFTTFPYYFMNFYLQYSIIQSHRIINEYCSILGKKMVFIHCFWLTEDIQRLHTNNLLEKRERNKQMDSINTGCDISTRKLCSVCILFDQCQISWQVRNVNLVPTLDTRSGISRPIGKTSKVTISRVTLKISLVLFFYIILTRLAFKSRLFSSITWPLFSCESRLALFGQFSVIEHIGRRISDVFYTVLHHRLKTDRNVVRNLK